MLVQGICPFKFEELKIIFQKYFDNNEEMGANFSIVKNNEILVNYSGDKKIKNSKWDENTIVNTFSLSKGIYASCIAKLIEKNEIDIKKSFILLARIQN